MTNTLYPNKPMPLPAASPTLACQNCNRGAQEFAVAKCRNCGAGVCLECESGGVCPTCRNQHRQQPDDDIAAISPIDWAAKETFTDIGAGIVAVVMIVLLFYVGSIVMQ